MAIQVRSCIARARLKHPAFTPQVIPASVGAEMVNEVQRLLLFATHQKNPSYLVRTWVIALLPTQNLASFGAGSGTGAPLQRGTTTLGVADAPAGALAQVDTADSAILIEARAATAGTLSGLEDSTQSWTVNLYVDQLVEIVAGVGMGQTAVITANTADALSIDGTWAIAPDASTIYRIRQQVFDAGGAMGVELGLIPATRQVQGWLVQLDATGQPFLNLAQPVSVPMTAGIPLPPNYHVLNGSWYAFSDEQNIDRYPRPLTMLAPIDRHQPARSYGVYVQGQELFLCAPMTQWQQVQRLEIPYLPIAPAISSADDYLLLPDAAEDAIVAGLALQMGERAATFGVAGMDLSGFDARQQQMQDLYLAHVAGAGRALSGRIKDVW